ncbi:MAG TPA: amidase [Rubrobacteraceae bacterium]|nr:amidase [Rubrobacteraceae bacterium]
MARTKRPVAATESGAFVEAIELGPIASGPLDGLNFAVKDLIDIASHKTGCGNPSWRDTHPVATANAVCVEQLLSAGARCVGKTVCDELAFSLIGENYFYGTPLNPKAPDRVPGGSSSGSASAVACGLADFALGTDTGGSVRVPASNCGVWGLRPSHGFISVAGVNPFAPTFDTVGILARSADVLARAAAVLFAHEDIPRQEPTTIHLLKEAFSVADPNVRQVLNASVQRLRNLFGERLRETSLGEIDSRSEETHLWAWYDTFCVLQWAEIESCLGAWVAATKPAFGPETAQNFELVKNLDRRRLREAVRRREKYFQRLKLFLGPHDLICMPTTPALAPLKGTVVARGQPGAGSDYYPRMLSLTSVAGIGRLPQVSLPLAESGGVPVGLSLLAAHGRDAFILGVAQKVASEDS